MKKIKIAFVSLLLLVTVGSLYYNYSHTGLVLRIIVGSDIVPRKLTALEIYKRPSLTQLILSDEGILEAKFTLTESEVIEWIDKLNFEILLLQDNESDKVNIMSRESYLNSGFTTIKNGFQVQINKEGNRTTCEIVPYLSGSHYEVMVRSSR